MQEVPGNNRDAQEINGLRLNFMGSLKDAAYALYQYKANSAFGRLLVWKVALQKPYQNLIVGDGIGAFEANYGHWQSDYFARGSGSDAEKKVADYVTCAYNEPLQIFIEQGLLGVFLWAGVFVAASTQIGRASCRERV